VEFWHEYRDWSVEPYTVGPSLQMINGKLKSYERELMDLPVDQWFHMEVRVGLGTQAQGTWEVTVTLPGQEPGISPTFRSSLPAGRNSPGWASSAMRRRRRRFT